MNKFFNHPVKRKKILWQFLKWTHCEVVFKKEKKMEFKIFEKKKTKNKRQKWLN